MCEIKLVIAASKCCGECLKHEVTCISSDKDIRKCAVIKNHLQSKSRKEMMPYAT